MGEARRQRRLEVKIDRDVLSITMGVQSLAFAVEHNPDLEIYDGESGEFKTPKVVDADAFAKEVLIILHREEEDGTTMVHEMLDKAVEMAIENGAEGIRLPEDSPYA